MWQPFKQVNKTAVLWSALTAALSLLAALATSQAVLAASLDGTVLIPGLAGIRYAWNHGISFSLFWSESTIGNTAILIGVLAVIVVLTLIVLRTQRVPTAMALGLILGGALGNAVDRIRLHAVFDYLYLHIGAIPLFVCNASDILITGGVIALVADDLARALRRS